MKQLFTTAFITYLLTASSLAISEPLHSQSQQEQPHRTEQQQKIYFKHLKYEYGNRGRTYIGMKVAAKHSTGSELEAFFQAYYEMEIINQKILNHMKDELGVDYQANWFIRNGIHAMTYLGWHYIDPQGLIDIIIPYIPKLQEMESLANPEHKPFFAYIVAQEQAQLEASQAAKENGWDSGAKVVRDFIPQAETELARLTTLANNTISTLR
jgi:hypothetical protein